MLKNKKYNIVLMFIIVIITIVILLSIILKIKYMNNKNGATDYSDILETNNSIINDDDITQNMESDTMGRVMLSGIVSDDEILITEDNIDRTEEIINGFNFEKGIYVSEISRNKFLEILYVVTDENYTISKAGYLNKKESDKQNDITQRINKLIDSNRLIVIDINETYKSTIDRSVVDITLEEIDYIQVFDYNNNTKIVLINPLMLERSIEDLTQKEIYEEVVIQILENIN